MAVAIVDHDRVVFEKGYGFTDLDKTTPITLDTVFAIGSLSKQFTAAAILQLADEGVLKLSDSAATYVPELPEDITIQQLLWQTAGLTEYAHGINLGKSPEELLHIVATPPPRFPAGTRWAYSNSNYYMLGRIVELASKQSYNDYLHAHVLVRAGLGATQVCPRVPEAHATIGGGSAVTEGNPSHFEFYGAAGFMCSSARDLLRWQNALFGGKVLVPDSLAKLTTPGTLADGTPTDYGDGWVIDTMGTHRRIWHNGEVSGYESLLSWFPDDLIQIVLLTNTENGPPANVLGKLERAIARDVLHIVSPKAVDQPLTTDAMQRYVGSFETSEVVATFTIVGTHLHVHIDGGVDANMLYQGGDRFVPEGHVIEYRYVGTGYEVWRDGTKIATLARTR